MKKIIIILFILGITAFSEIKAVGEKNIIRIGIPYRARTINPQEATDSVTLAVARQIYDTLFFLEEDGSLKNELAENYEIISDNEIHLQIRDNVYFSDGTILTSADVASSLQFALEAPRAMTITSVISGVEDMGDGKVKIIHSSTPSLILHNLTHLSTSIQKPNSDSEIKIIGTGPYKVVTWGNGEKIELSSNEKYFKGKPKIDDLAFFTIPENTTRYIGLEIGEIDIAYDLLPSDIKTLNQNEELRSIISPSYGIDFVGLNTEKITDENLRRAIMLGINKEDVSNAVFESIPTITSYMLPPNVFGYNSDVVVEGYNPTKAKELVDSLDVELPIILSLYTYDEPSRVQMAQVIQGNLREIGIDLRIQTLEVSAFLQRTANSEHDMLIGLWYMSTGDADFGFYPLLHSSSAGAAGNRSFYRNDKMDNLIELAREEKEVDKRLEYYKEIQEYIAQDIPLIPLMYKSHIIGLNKEIKGFIFHPSGSHLLYQVEKNSD